MSDFLDRMAARAIGGDATLAPRLPSLFEPLQRAPIMPSLDEGEAPARPHDALAAAPPAHDIANPPRSPVPARASIEPPAAHVTPAPRAPLPTPARAATERPRELLQPPPAAASPARASAAEPAATPSVPARPTASLSPLPPRQVRVAPARQEAARRAPVPGGALLPAPSPVFATTPAASASPGPRRTVQAAAHAERAVATTEPVVHVSIGRLEVRAAPAAAAPPRRREGPRPGSLDDYLRQRGKASP